MILHPGILSLVVGSAVVIVMMLYASTLSLKVLATWNINSSSSAQLSLERKTYLLSTIMNYVLGFEILATFLFVYTTDNIHRLFIGAMCTTGSLNANPIGWKVFYTKVVIFFISSIWIALNIVDQKAENYPLVKTKYAILLTIVPLIILDAFFQLKYFLGLKPNIITSCCGSLFREGGEGAASDLSSLPMRPMIIAFYLVVSVFLLNAFIALGSRKSVFKFTSTILSVLLFFVSIASIISFVSLFFYETPTHHCPFDIIQKDYNFIGYPIYIALFGGVFFGIIIGVFEPLKRITSLNNTINKLQKKWIISSIVLILIFAVLCSWPILFSTLTFD